MKILTDEDGDEAAQPTSEPLPASTTTPQSTPTPHSTPTPAPQACEALTDFSIGAQNLGWFIVNDNVMGGRSEGGVSFRDSTMVFEGAINTDGGGFSSVRVEVGSNAMTGFQGLTVRARTDGREYKLILEDSLVSRDRRVSHQVTLAFAATDEWQTVEALFIELEPRIFGRAVQSDPFRADLVTQLGVMISDGVDGPFRIEIDSISLCS